MAYIEKLTEREKIHGRPHTRVKATYFFTDEGYLQIDTYGSDKRKYKGDSSQSMQFSPEMMEQLYQIWQEHNHYWRKKMNSKEKAEKGLSLLEEAFLEEIKQNGRGPTQTNLADRFDIREHNADKGYLEWSICHRLEYKKKIKMGCDFNPPRTPKKGWWSVD